MSLYILRHTQRFPVSKEVMWSFISSPKNLAKITPEKLQFVTLSGDENEIHTGQIIRYTLTPLLGIRVNWVTEIKHVQDGVCFIDEQRFGPYSMWHHKHLLKEIPGGVEVEDVVHYKLPLGPLGHFAHSLFVKRDIQQIFEFRRKKLIELFGELKKT
jgi:ligand-binding SRPBCC domain-containing protein